MADEPAKTEEGAPPEPAAEAPAVPEVQVVNTTKTVVDTSGFDAAIKSLEDFKGRDYVPAEEIVAIDSRIAELRAEKAKAEQDTIVQELEQYRRKEFDQQIAKLLPEDISPDSIRGETNEERLANAKLVAEVAKKYEAKLKEAKGSGPTPEQIEAHGEPVVPGAPDGVPEGHNPAQNIGEGIDKGDLARIVNDPEYEKRLERAFKLLKAKSV